MLRSRFHSWARVSMVTVTFGLGQLLLSCSDVTVPPGVLLTCTADQECPGAQVCEPTTGICVDGSARALLVETSSVTPQRIGLPFLDGNQAIAVSVSLSAAPLSTPKVALLTGALDVVAEFDVAISGLGDGSVFVADLVPPADIPEGTLLVAVDAVDARGVPNRFFLTPIEVDITPPEILTPSLQTRVDPQSVPVAFQIAGSASRVGPAVNVRVGFATSEAVVLEGDGAPRVVMTGSPLELIRDPAIENPFFFDLVWPAATTSALDGAFTLTARVTDLAGNVTETVLPIGNADNALEIDTTAPAAPLTTTPGAIVFERAPWGRNEVPTQEVYTVVGQPGAVQADALVIVTRDPEGIREIGRVTAGPDGAFGGVETLSLSTGDLGEVFLVVADAAGNFSPPEVVREGLWIATPGEKIAGNLASNPHIFEGLPVFRSEYQRRGAFELDAADGISMPDGDRVTTLGAGSWEKISPDPQASLSPRQGVLVEPAFGHDPVSGVSVLFGGRATASTEAYGGIGQATCSGAMDDVWVRAVDGRFRRLVFEPGAPRPSAMHAARFAFDSKRQRLVLTGRTSSGGNEVWAFKDGRFEQLCVEDACASTMPTELNQHGFVYDPVHDVFVAHLSRFTNATYTFDGTVWTQVCGGDTGCVGPGSRAGSMAFDAVRGVPVWFDGETLFAWDTTEWTPLCVDATCAASKPPLRQDAAIAFDRHRGVVVMFGGQPDAFVCDLGSQLAPPDVPNPDPAFSDTWEFDGSVWTERTSTTTPPGRALHAMGWDEHRGRIVVSGGDDCNCMQQFRTPWARSGFDEDFWEWDGIDWRRVDDEEPPPAGFSAEGPVGARDHAATDAPQLGGVVFFGDQDGDSRVHLLRDGRFFQSNEVTTAIGKFLPAMATSPSGEVFLSGGGSANEGGGGPTGGDGIFRLEQHLVVPDCTGDCSAWMRTQPFGHGLTHDGERLVSFGGNRVGGGGGLGFSLTELATDDNYVYTADAGFTTPCEGGACTALPPRRLRGQMAPTGILGQSLLFGGFPGGQATWTFDGTTWTEESPSTVPPSRQGHLLVYDAGRDAVVMTSGTPHSTSNDVRGASDTLSIPPAYGDVYEWVDGEWFRARVVDVEGDGNPGPRYGVAGAADPVLGGVVMHGGTPSPEKILADVPTPSTTRLTDVWHWKGGETTRPAQRFRVSTRAASLREGQDVTSAAVRWVGTGTLYLWDGFGWSALSTASCGPDCQEATLDGATVRQAIFGDFGELVFATVGDFNPPAPAYSAVETDFVEVRVRYQ